MSGSLPDTIISPQFCSFCDRTVAGPREDSLALRSEHAADPGVGVGVGMVGDAAGLGAESGGREARAARTIQVL